MKKEWKESKETYKLSAFPAHPTPLQQSGYHASVLMKVVNASKHSDNEEIAWLNEVLVKGFQELGGNSPRGKSYRYHELDKLISQRVYEKMPPRLKKKVDKKNFDFLAYEETYLKGRQLLWITYDDLKSVDPCGSLYYEDALRALRDLDDNNVEKWLEDWDWLYEHLRAPLPYEKKRHLFHEKVKKTKIKQVQKSLEDFDHARLQIHVQDYRIFPMSFCELPWITTLLSWNPPRMRNVE